MALYSKNKFLALGIVVGFAFIVNCTNKENAEATAQKDSASCAAEKPINPNGDSELSLLMRKMMKTSESLKELVKQGKVPTGFPEEFTKIHSAKPTDSDTKKESFTAFAGNYLSTLEALYQSKPEELESNYNAVVGACVTCHTEHCPGPLKAINKLKI